MAHSLDSHPADYDAPLGDLLNDLAGEISDLFHDEIELAKVEMGEKLTKTGRAAAILGAAGLVALLAAGVLTATIVLALSTVLQAWLAALVVTGVYAVIAGLLGLVGYRRFKEAGTPTPDQAIASVKEDVSWAKQQAKSATT